MRKKDLGQYFTRNDIWLKPQIKDFMLNSGVSSVLDPFCGNGDLLKVARDLGFKNCVGYDIDSTLNWKINDSLKYIEKTDALILTNPPYLAKNSAKRRKSPSYKYFDGNNYSDLYLIALDRILDSSEKSVVIIPESFLQTGLFCERLHSLTVIEDNPFIDTECPVCVACFDDREKDANEVAIFKNNEFLFTMDELNRMRKKPKNTLPLTFNDKEGQVGIRCIDGVQVNNNICYSKPDKLNYDLNKICTSSRSITVVGVETDKSIEKLISTANDILYDYREKTKDLLLCAFKGNQTDNSRRRRLDFATARAIMEEAVACV